MVGLSTRQMRRKPIGTEHLLEIKPLTPAQEKVFDAWSKNKHLFLFGAAGTGKSFITMYLALKDISLKELISTMNSSVRVLRRNVREWFSR